MTALKYLPAFKDFKKFFKVSGSIKELNKTAKVRTSLVLTTNDGYYQELTPWSAISPEDIRSGALNTCEVTQKGVKSEYLALLRLEDSKKGLEAFSVGVEVCFTPKELDAHYLRVTLKKNSVKNKLFSPAIVSSKKFGIKEANRVIASILRDFTIASPQNSGDYLLESLINRFFESSLDIPELYQRAFDAQTQVLAEGPLSDLEKLAEASQDLLEKNSSRIAEQWIKVQSTKEYQAYTQAKFAKQVADRAYEAALKELNKKSKEIEDLKETSREVTDSFSTTIVNELVNLAQKLPVC